MVVGRCVVVWPIESSFFLLAPNSGSSRESRGGGVTRRRLRLDSAVVETAPAMPAPWPSASHNLRLGCSTIAARVVERDMQRKQAQASKTHSSAVAGPAPYDDADYGASADSGSADDTDVSESQEESQSSESEASSAQPRSTAAGVSAGGDLHGGGAEAEVRAGGRQVSLPEAPESNVGAFGMFVANWKGSRSEESVNDNIASDIISRNPAAIMMVCQVDYDFIESLQRPSQCPRATSLQLQPASAAAPAVAGRGRAAAQREPNYRAWHVAATCNTEEGNKDSNALIVAAKSSRASACRELEVLVLLHKKYEDTNGKTTQACSRVLAAEIQWHLPMAGRSSLRVLNVHLHHDVAKQVLDAQTP